MDPTQDETRLGAVGAAREVRGPAATTLDVAVSRVVAAAVTAGLLVSFLALALLHRGSVVRQLISEADTAAQIVASTLTGERAHGGREVDAAPLLEALLQVHAIERVTWLPAESEPPLCLTRAGATLAPWQRPGEVQLGQWLGPERFRLARGVARSGRSDSILVVEGSLEQAVRREAENVAHAARVFALVVLLTLCLSPWLGRRVAARWADRLGRPKASSDPLPGSVASTSPNAAPPAPEPASRSARATSTAVRALVVDDNEQNRQLVQYLLTKRGYSVDVACDGQSALDAFTLGAYDVVLMDCQMPGMDGFEATRQIRQLERARTRRVPILAMSAGAFGSDVQACRDAGMDDHIAKPFHPKELLARLEFWVASALHDIRGAVAEPPRRRVTAREAGFVPVTSGARPMPPHEGAVDERVLGPLLDDEGGRSLAEELIALFSTSGPETLLSLERRLAAGELDEVARIAHRFVSTSGSVGAVRLARVMREVEGACNRQRPDEASALLGHASGELDVASSVLHRRFRRPSDVDGGRDGTE
jgi:CheY-like chemotaxis protein/HPt (histidine-containing phosphotransfer) domain-containing protein